MSSLFIDSLLSGQYPVIAEVKVRASDGTDLMRGRSVAEIANAYRDIGAPCLSVVTGSWFGGAEGMLEDVVREGRRPVLQKDFITKESQICAAADKGAAAVLLTARLLPRAVLCYLAETALRQKLTPFVEVATEKEVDGLRLASDCIVAVNNKDIARRERGAGDLNRSRALLPLVLATGTQCAVSASGIKTPEDGARLIAAGYQGLLVGTSLLKSDDIGAWFAGLSRASAPKEADL